MDRATRISIRFLLVWALEALSLVVMTRLVPGIGLLTRDAWSAFANALTVALILAFMNTLVRPFLLRLRLPINWLTVGGSTLFVNVLLLIVTSTLLLLLDIRNLAAAFLGGLVLSPQSVTYDGFGLSAIVEFVPAKQGVIYYGLSLYNTRANYPIIFNVETSGSSAAFSPRMIWYLGLLAGYEF